MYMCAYMYMYLHLSIYLLSIFLFLNIVKHTMHCPKSLATILSFSNLRRINVIFRKTLKLLII